MAASSTMKRSSPLLTLPLELREEIYSNLLLPQHVYTSSASPDTYTLHRSNKTPPTYVDTRIYLPARFPTSMLRTCRQLRDECISFHARRLSSLLPATMTDDKSPQETLSHKVALRNNTQLDEVVEREFDQDTARVTLEILRGVRGTFGFHIPERNYLSPRFTGLTPLLSKLRKIKFTVWAGYDWWSGISTRPVATRKKTQKSVFKRTYPDQLDQVRQSDEVEEDDQPPAQPPRPDRLYLAITHVLRHLPFVEEMNVDVLLHLLDFSNWDLPEEGKWVGVRGWLDGPVCSDMEGKLKRVYRRLIVVHPGVTADKPILKAVLLRQSEILQDKGGVRVERGINKLSPDWDGSGDEVPEPPLTELFVRSE